jgi:hypothetical protein
MPNLLISSYQIALFPKDFRVDNLNDLFKKLLELKQFDGDNLFLPVPDNAPKEVPRAILRTKDKSIECQISFNKIDIFWRNVEHTTTYKVEKDVIIATLANIWDNVLGDKKIKRIGFITEFFSTVLDPIEFITSKIVQPGVVTGLQSYACNFTYAESTAGQNCNHRITIQNGELVEEETKKIILLTSDFNTHQDIDTDFDSLMTTSFISEVYSKTMPQEVYAKMFGEGV